MREISFGKIEEIQKKIGLNDSEMAELLGLYVQKDSKGNSKGSTQYYNYRKTYSVPADRFYAARDSLLLCVEDKLREERQRILDLFS